MKKLLSIVTILIFATITTVNAKSIVKDTETFTISTNDNAGLEINTNKSWTVEYNAADKSFEVIKLETKKGEEYIVRNQFFEVRYVNTDKGFGVRKIKSNQSQVNQMITENVINDNELVKQSMLSSIKLDEEKALSYIAGFVPYLLNENYKHILN